MGKLALKTRKCQISRELLGPPTEGKPLIGALTLRKCLIPRCVPGIEGPAFRLTDVWHSGLFKRFWDISSMNRGGLKISLVPKNGSINGRFTRYDFYRTRQACAYMTWINCRSVLGKTDFQTLRYLSGGPRLHAAKLGPKNATTFFWRTRQASAS